jgi:magnesium transporter
MPNGQQKTFFFLSEIINHHVFDVSTGRKIGRIRDLVSNLGEIYPKVSAFIMKERATRQPLYVAWKHVTRIVPGEGLYVNAAPDALQWDFTISDNEFLLKEAFWDKQIVDIQGSKVVRVNDLHMLNEGLNLWVAHVDVGITGLLRRLGCLGFVNYFVRLMTSVEIKDRFISWKFVQPVTHNVGMEALSLKVRQSQLTELAPGDLADILVELGADERVAVLKSVDAATAANSLQVLPLKIQLQIAEVMDQKDLLSIIGEMPVADIANLVVELPKKRAHWILSHIPEGKAAQVSNLVGKSANTAQRIMRMHFLSTRPDATAAMVLEQIRMEHRKRDFSPYIYIVGDDNILVGVVSLHQLLMAPPEKLTAEFMRKRLTKVNLNTNVRVVAEVFYKYDFTVVPVVDRQNHMQGIITMKDALASVFPEIREEITR